MGSATWIEVGTDAAWSAETHMLANLVDLTVWANYQRGGGEGTKPKPIPRPEQARAEQERTERVFDKAAKFALRQQAKRRASTPPTTARPRDERGRFVSQKG